MIDEDLRTIKSELVYKLVSVVDDLDCVDTKEMGCIVDMIKDISEAVYYHVITEAMENKYEVDDDVMNYTRMIDKRNGRLNYSSSGRDSREGKSYISRKNYMESKENHADKSVLLKDLEKYANELTSDIMDMIADLSVEEKQLLQHKIATLANKIV